MDRMTKRWGDNPAVPCAFPLDFMFYMKMSQAKDLIALFNRLADYEDTGLSPQEIVAMRDELGRLHTAMLT